MFKRHLIFMIALIIVSSLMLPTVSMAAGSVALYKKETYGVRFKLTGTGWSSYIVKHSSNGGFKDSNKFQRPSGAAIHVIRCNGSATFTFLSTKGETVNTETVSVSGITNEHSECNPPAPKPEPPAPKTITPKPVQSPPPVKNQIIKVPPAPKPVDYAFDTEVEKNNYTSVTLNTNVTKQGSKPPKIQFFDDDDNLLEEKILAEGEATYAPDEYESFGGYKIVADDEIYEKPYKDSEDWFYANSDGSNTGHLKEVYVLCSPINPLYSSIDLEFGVNHPVDGDITMSYSGSVLQKYWDDKRKVFTPPTHYDHYKVRLRNAEATSCKIYEVGYGNKVDGEATEFEFNIVKAMTTSPFISKVAGVSTDEEECDTCKIFSCPGWDQHMGKLDEIKNAIPPPPDWPKVADTFRDSIVPKMINDLDNLLGKAPEPPAAPAQLPGLDDRGIKSKEPQMQDVPGLKEAGFTADKIKNEAQTIPEREDPTGGFDLTKNPIDTLPAAPENPKPGETDAGEWGKNKPKEQDNPFPYPKDQGVPEVGNPPKLGNSDATPPTPEGDSGTAPKPGSNLEAAPKPSEDSFPGLKDYKSGPDSPNGSGKDISP